MERKIRVPEDKQELEQFLLAARFEGERFVIIGEEGALAALVPVEDLEILEKIEG